MTEPTCEDCAVLIERERADLPGLDGPALHIAVGVLYGGWACDHVDWTWEDAAHAYAALYDREMRKRWRVEQAACPVSSGTSTRPDTGTSCPATSTGSSGSRG